MANRKLKGVVKEVNRMRNVAVNRQAPVGTQGIIQSTDLVTGPFKFEADEVFHNGDHVNFELTPRGNVVNVAKMRRRS